MRKIKFWFIYNSKNWEWEKSFHSEKDSDVREYLILKQKNLPVSLEQVKWKQIN